MTRRRNWYTDCNLNIFIIYDGIDIFVLCQENDDSNDTIIRLLLSRQQQISFFVTYVKILQNVTDCDTE